MPAVLLLVDALDDATRATADARAATPALVLAVVAGQDETRARNYLENIAVVQPPVTVECLRAPPGCVKPTR